mmetsp:Transcript_26241/g.38894  ORF Transcript_26241/g.38894 Transcript_26241/m.38894 type:complete len:423 (+) Transcript_26241:111-1379(+)|eukprot:CAMPEP_0185037618 /NCGR_PEP_ID=MMETSP1103-20130426/32316_1 /TAXON_ID=36769 /ORGANISM="Paraphysomonas bandaiensis, Strain Caron Lab Isolate" /LENGTH=422 /DNA_ID=CAMNT_0027575687 /DNA_START=63 /DNA_END=1331 /DNA_ORIENTATION=-
MITTIEELRLLAQRRVPRMFYDYVDSGSWTESTYRRNESDFQRIKFRQRIARDMSNRSTKTSMIGHSVSMPVALAPIGLLGMQRANGEVLAAQAAAEFGIPFTLSTMSICSIEEVARQSSAPFWFQLYVMRDHEYSKRLIQRAKAAECSALVITLDLQVMGQRHKDIKNGLSAPPKPVFRNILNMATKPQWCFEMLQTRNHTFGNIVGHVEGVSDTSSLSAWSSEQFDLTLNWDDVARIKDWWGGKLILKGIMDPEDAVLAVKAGADAIVVSNHGGRQLDDADSSIAILPEIVRALNQLDLHQSSGSLDNINGENEECHDLESVLGQLNSGNLKRPKATPRTEIWLDGGIRSGQDVLKAIALGARGVLLGRAYAYGLGADGKNGVKQSLDIIHKELDLTMALCGHRDIHDIDGSIIRDCPFS